MRDGTDIQSRDNDLTELASVAMALPDAVLVVDPQAQIRWVNRACERLFGIPAKAAIGSSGLDFIHPDDLQLAVLALTSVQAKEVGTPLELRVQGAEGWKLVEMIGAPLGDDLVLSVRDLTERRRWEVAGDEIARFRSLMQNAASVTMLLSREGIVESSSGGLTRWLGVDQEWLEGRPLTHLADDLDLPVLDAAFCEVRATPEGRTPVPVTVDVRLRHASGTTVPFALTFTNLLDDPTVGGLVVTGHDISDRVAVESDLRAANSVLAATLESTADGILVVDGEGRIASFNTPASWRCGDCRTVFSTRVTTTRRSHSCWNNCAIPRRSSPKCRSSTTNRIRRAMTRSSSRTGASSSATRSRNASTARSSGGSGASVTSANIAGSRTSSPTRRSTTL